ncbi:MAG TPA: hypothetical protein EYP57_05795 [Thermodesulfobacteriaceae bacterium]|nr:hypothetical protein [Thermodesulfobacteriaceae bacterium]
MTPQSGDYRNDRKSLLRYFIPRIFLLGLFSVLVIISAVGTYNVSIEGSRSLLETRAMDVAVSVGFSLDRMGLSRNLLPELVDSDKWHDLAFLALYDQDGTILLHSNPLLVGRQQLDPHIERVISDRLPEKYFSTLATGEQVFVLDFPLHLRIPQTEDMQLKKQIDQEMNSQDSSQCARAGNTFYCLRITIHPYPAQTITGRATLQIIMVVFSLVILWVFTYFFLRNWNKRAKLEAQLREQKRMAALGEMAAVLAHEIRNPLSIIKGFAQYHLEKTKDPGSREDFTIIVEESRRLENLTNNLLIYARPTRLAETEFETEKLCRDIRRNVGQIPGDVNFRLECSNMTVFMDREKLIQIAINLLNSAFDAVKDLHEPEVYLGITSAGEDLILTVEDSGPGLPAEVLDRLFEPFVTTKTKGTGLGLAIVHRLVSGMDGDIIFEKRENGGTRVRVRLPMKNALAES